MHSVGTKLREARERKGYSLDEINARTRINSKNLLAIETDEVKEISSPFFYRSFVRQYAEAVDLDFVTLASGVESLVGIMRQPDLPGQGKHQIVRVAPIHPRLKRDWSWMIATAVFLAVVAAGSGGYRYLKIYFPSLIQNSTVSRLFSKPNEAKSVSPAVPTLRAGASSGAASKDTQASSADTAVAVADGLPPGANSQAANSAVNPSLDQVADKIHLELAATERTWLSVSADGKPAYTGILEPAQKKILEGQDSATLRTGNAGGVNIIFNGKSIGAIGPRGKTRTVVFSKTGYEIQRVEGTTLTANHIGG